MRRIAALSMLAALVWGSAGCRGEPSPPPSPPAAGSDARSSELRFDRPAIRIGGPQTWTHASTVVALAFCGADRELVTLDDTGRLRRFTVASGEQTSSVSLGAPVANPVVECGTDDTAELRSAAGSVRVDRWSTITRPPATAGPAPRPLAEPRRPLRSALYEIVQKGATLLVVRLADDFRREIRDACTEPTDALAISHDGAHVAIACRQPLGIRIFEIASGVQTTDDLPSLAAARLAWSPRRDRLALRSLGGAIHVFGDRLADKPTSAGHTVWWHSDTEVALDTAHGVLAWTPPDGATRSLDATPGVRAATTGERAMIVASRGALTAIVDGVAKEIVLPRDYVVERVELAPTGRRAIAFGSGMTLELDLVAGIATRIAIPHTAATIDDAGVVLATSRGIERAGASPPLAHHGAQVTALAIAGDLLAAGDRDGAISLFRGGALIGRLVGHDGAVVALAFAGDGRLASSGDDTALLWDLRP